MRVDRIYVYLAIPEFRTGYVYKGFVVAKISEIVYARL